MRSNLWKAFADTTSPCPGNSCDRKCDRCNGYYRYRRDQGRKDCKSHRNRLSKKIGKQKRTRNPNMIPIIFKQCALYGDKCKSNAVSVTKSRSAKRLAKQSAKPSTDPKAKQSTKQKTTPAIIPLSELLLESDNDTLSEIPLLAEFLFL